jgi:hypothetical protein
MQDGFIYELINVIVSSLNYLNIVQLFKFVAKKLTPTNSSEDEIIANANIAIDIFIVLKWVFIIFLWLNDTTSPFWTLAVGYLIWSNLHTYFYHHLWKKDKNLGYKKTRRRFMNLIQALVFSNIAFAYLYSSVFYNNFSWGFYSGDKYLGSVIYSFLQSFFIGSNNIYPVNSNGGLVSMIQVLVSFLFITVILSTSIPTQKEKITKRKKDGIQK